MNDLTQEVDLIMLGGGQSARAAAALASHGVNVMLCHPSLRHRSGLQGELLRTLGEEDVACVAHLSVGGGVRIETDE